MSDASPRDPLETREGIVDGQRASIRVNRALWEETPLARSWFSWHLTLTILLEHALPDRGESEVLERLEDDLHALVTGTTDAQYVGRVTTGVIREVHYYVESPEEPHEAITAFIERGTPRTLEHLISQDIPWSEVAQLFED